MNMLMDKYFILKFILYPESIYISLMKVEDEPKIY